MGSLTTDRRTPDGAKIAVIGLGYVGFPLALTFAERYVVVGYDCNISRVKQLRQQLAARAQDKGLEVPQLSLADNPEALKDCNVYIVTVPTPVNKANQPDFSHLSSASLTVGGLLDPGDTVIYESTVYPGATQEICAPILEKASGLRRSEDFFLGYSPERIDPGSLNKGVKDIVKVTSGCCEASRRHIASLYQSVITAGIYDAESIEVAEAAKVIENTQRDLNIALMNDLAVFFDRIGLETSAVLAAANTKWNFLDFKPGLVGGHCIGVDPYYLTFKAHEVGHDPHFILAGRRINESMPSFIATKLMKALFRRGALPSKGPVLVLGLTFKENCPDTRNSKVPSVIREILDYGLEVDAHDPYVEENTEISCLAEADLKKNVYCAVVIAVAHREFIDWGIEKIKSFGTEGALVFDVKGIFEKQVTDLRL